MAGIIFGEPREGKRRTEEEKETPQFKWDAMLNTLKP